MSATKRKPDRRVVKTKNAIRRAFIKLLLEKEYNKITVKDLAAAADVDRKTIYNYYRGIYEVRDELENEFVQMVDKVVSNFKTQDIYSHTKQLFEAITDVLNQNLEVCGYLFQRNANSQIVIKTIYFVKDRIYDVLNRNYPDPIERKRIKMVSEFVSAGMIVVYQDWFNSDKSTSLEELSQELYSFIMKGLSAFTQE